MHHKKFKEKNIDVISINFNVHVYDSGEIVFYKHIIVKQPLIYIENICLFY